MEAITTNVNRNIFKDFKAPKINPLYDTQKKEEHRPKEKRSVSKTAVPLMGAVLATIIPLILYNKMDNRTIDKQAKGFDKFREIAKYFSINDAKRILTTGITSIIGGVIGGFIVDKNKENRKEKLKEGIFESINVTLPTLIAAGTLKALESKKKDKGLMKLVPFVLGLGLGIPTASRISGKISQKIFKEDETKTRKFHPKDFLVHTDDMVDALVLLKFPLVDKLQIDKILALIYIKCGFEAGSKEADK